MRSTLRFARSKLSRCLHTAVARATCRQLPRDADVALACLKPAMVLILDGLVQLARFGPMLSTKMAVYSTAALPWGLGAAGAEGVKQGVDSEDAEGINPCLLL